MKALPQYYNLSTDYERLYRLSQQQRIVCFVPYPFGVDKDKQTLQTAQTQRYSPNDTEAMEIGSKGVAYVSAFDTKELSMKEDFIEQCMIRKILFIEPQNISIPFFKELAFSKFKKKGEEAYLNNIEMCSWEQTFSNTAGPHGGIGGQALTKFPIFAFINEVTGNVFVHCSGFWKFIPKEKFKPFEYISFN